MDLGYSIGNQKLYNNVDSIASISEFENY